MKSANQIPNNIKENKNFELYKSWIQFYSKVIGINIVIDENLPSPAAVPDNSERQQLTIMLNPKLLKEKYNLSNEELLFVLFHEVEHLIEDAQLRQSADGSRISSQKKTKMEEAKHLAKALHTLENIMRDIFVNNNVLQKAPVLNFAKDSNYRNYFFKEKDFLNMPVMDKDGKNTIERKALPKHLQFAYTILREAMLPDERCIIDPEVRKIVDRLKKFGSINKAITGNLAERLEQIWKAIEPTYIKLLEEDIKNNKDNSNGNGQGQKGQNQGQPSPNQSDSQPQQGGEGQQSGNQNGQPQGSEQDGDPKGEGKDGDKGEKLDEGKNDKKHIPQNPKDNSNGNGQGQQGQNQGQPSPNQSDSQPQQGGEGQQSGNQNGQPQGFEQDGDPKGEGKDGDKGEKLDEGKNDKKHIPQNPFDKLYKDMDGLPHILEDNLNSDNMKKVKKQINNKIDSSKPKSKERMELEKRAENMGINPENTQDFENIIKQLSEYDNFLKQLKEIKDPDTGNGVMEEILNLFQKIRAKRLKPKIKSRGPVDIDHGARLHPSSLASGIGELKSGNLDPLMFQENIKVDKEKQFIGEFELSIVADGSGSMNEDGGVKNAHQKISCLLMFEALKMLHDKLEMERMNLTKPVNFSTDGIMFDGESTRKIKDPGTDFTDKERLEAYSVLDYANGIITNDFDGLNKIIINIQSKSTEYLEGLRTGKIKKIVLVLTDGGSSNADKMKEKINYLRSIGVLVYGIGITSAGSPVVDMFTGSDIKLGVGKVCKNPTHLAKTLKDLLLPHLEKI